MAGLQYRTLDGLNAERFGTAWYWRLVAYIASCMILGGFLMLPSTFDSNPQLRISKAALGIFGVALLTAGFSLTALMWFACPSRIFQADCVFLPSLTSCAIGLLTVFYCFIISSRFVWNVAALLTAVGAAVFAIVYAVLLIWTHRNIATARKDPNPEPVSLLRQPSINTAPVSPPWHEPTYYSNHVANMYPAAQPYSSQQQDRPVGPPAEELTEEDLMRQQMLMLLQTKPESPLTPEPTMNSFNRIDFNIPNEEGPSHQPVYGYYAPQSAPSSRQNWQGRPLQPWDGVWRSDERRPSETARREERRREIEMRR
ncbi:hypothetical protein MBLNU459_g3710t1 [Dothideomycetes sp. NU459]